MSQRHRSASSATRWDSLPDPGPRFQLGERLGMGVCGEIFQATDLQQDNLQVAVKIQRITEENWEDLEEEYAVLKNHSTCPFLPDFYGAFCKKCRDGDQLWLAMELCEGGSVIELVRAIHKTDKKLCELHLAYILKDTIQAVVYLHQNHIMHRDIRASNILLTKSGEIKLCDFGLSRELRSTLGKRGSTVGSPCWMAPELVTSEQKSVKIGHDVYDNRVDTWALGITAIELADGKAPFENIHPTRALFQIVSNPPPTLYRPASWSQLLNDFINECLVKDPQNRPVVMELIEHPFLTQVPENTSFLMQELKAIMENVKNIKKERHQEVVVRGNFLKSEQSLEPEVMYLEDLAALENLTEDIVIEQLQQRLKKGGCYSYLGDVLLFVNPNEQLNIYNDEVQSKYMFKSRSENRPHIYSVADCAYQDVLHHNEAQHIVFSGESMSGKSANMMHVIRHLLWLGKGNIAVAVRILSSLNVIQAMGNACTPLNGNSTRHVLNTQMTFTTTGKVSGAIFMMYQLERWRVTSTDRRQGNFHIFYYFFDYLASKRELPKYMLEQGQRYRYLRQVATPSGCNGFAVPSDSNNASNNSRQFESILQSLNDLEFGADNLESLKKILAAILLLGEIRFRDGGGNKAEVENPKVAGQVAQLLDLDEKKFSWALVNYCLIEKGSAVKMQQSPDDAEVARDALARTMYMRLVDWLINFMNLKLAYSRAVFGDRHMISVLDLFGFECFQKNGIEQLFVNSLNEQLQYHYTQRLFAWEMQERLEDEVKGENLTFYDNRPAVDLLMGKPDGLMWMVDEASRTSQGGEFIIDTISGKKKTPFCVASSGNEFSVAHYTGKVTYDATEMPEKNKDFVPPEVTETLRRSNDENVRMLFTNMLSRTGNLVQCAVDVPTAEKVAPKEQGARRASKWGAVLVAEKQKATRSYNTQSKGQFSQTRRMRTATTTFRAVSLEILRFLSTGGTHFVRCLRAELTGQPRGFQPEVVRQQLRALSVLDTVRARQRGYPCRVVFSEFLRRYKFLAFDFDETVDITGDNCRLLMVRLKMEGYAMGKTKVYLKYYNEEYLARLYEVQVKKIVKVQAMMRTFLARKKVNNAENKAPGCLAGDPEQSNGKDRPSLAESEPLSRFRQPLDSVLDYLDDPVVGDNEGGEEEDEAAASADADDVFQSSELEQPN